MDLGLAGKNALVTGGSLGIGHATAAALAAHGANVVISARDVERTQQAAKEIADETGGRVVAVPGDMGKKAEIDAMFATARAALGHIDILINNAGASPAGRIHELTDEQWLSSFEVKLMGYVRCARTALPDMISRRWGRIINVSGRGGEVVTPSYLLGCFNAAVNHFTRALALEAAPHQVLVNAVSPAATNTPRLQAIMAHRAQETGKSVEEVLAAVSANVPVGRAAEPQDVADLIAFLCSQRASHIAGAIVNVDGGGAHGV